MTEINKDNCSTRTKLFALIDDIEIVSKELLEFSGTSKTAKQNDIDPSLLINLLKERDEEFQETLKLAKEQKDLQEDFDKLKSELDKRDLSIKQLQKNLKEAESILASSIYEVRQKLKSIQQANSRKIPSEELIKYAHKISASNAVAMPPTWAPGDPRRPYPTEMDMRHGLLYNTDFSLKMMGAGQSYQDGKLSQGQSLSGSGLAGQQLPQNPSQSLTWQPSAEVQSILLARIPPAQLTPNNHSAGSSSGFSSNNNSLSGGGLHELEYPQHHSQQSQQFNNVNATVHTPNQLLQLQMQGLAGVGVSGMANANNTFKNNQKIPGQNHLMQLQQQNSSMGFGLSSGPVLGGAGGMGGTGHLAQQVQMQAGSIGTGQQNLLRQQQGGSANNNEQQYQQNIQLLQNMSQNLLGSSNLTTQSHHHQHQSQQQQQSMNFNTGNFSSGPNSVGTMNNNNNSNNLIGFKESGGFSSSNQNGFSGLVGGASAFPNSNNVNSSFNNVPFNSSNSNNPTFDNPNSFSNSNSDFYNGIVQDAGRDIGGGAEGEIFTDSMIKTELQSQEEVELMSSDSSSSSSSDE